jgi:preprotein translocase subunit SecG
MEAFMLSPDHIVVAGVMNDIAVYTFRTLFFLSAVLLMAIVLMQEGKGGGLASALGGQGAETFGVSTGGVNRVTLFLAGLFLVSALGHALAFEQSVTSSLKGSKKAPPGNGGGTAPGGSEEELKKIMKDMETQGGGQKGTPKEGSTAPVKEPAKDAPKEEPAKTEPPKDGK